MEKPQSRTATILRSKDDALLREWLREMGASGTHKDSRISEADLQSQSREFLSLLQAAVSGGDFGDLGRPDWKPQNPGSRGQKE